MKIIKKSKLHYVTAKHPVTGKRVKLHRYVMECFLGRQLTKDEVVHHKDHDTTNNNIHNLILLTHIEHRKLHGIENIVIAGGNPDKQVICIGCKKPINKALMKKGKKFCLKCVSIRIKDPNKKLSKKYTRYYKKYREKMASEEYKQYQKEYQKEYRQSDKYKAKLVEYKKRRNKRSRERYAAMKKLNGLTVRTHVFDGEHSKKNK